MAVGVTKAVRDPVSTALSSMLRQVNFSCFIRDSVVLSTLKEDRQGYTRQVFGKRHKCFAAEVRNTLSDVAAGEIWVLFQPQTQTKVFANVNTKEDYIQSADMVDGAQNQNMPC